MQIIQCFRIGCTQHINCMCWLADTPEKSGIYWHSHVFLCWSRSSSTVQLTCQYSEETPQLSRHTMDLLELVRNNARNHRQMWKILSFCPGKIYNWKKTTSATHASPNYTLDSGCDSLSFNALHLKLGKKKKKKKTKNRKPKVLFCSPHSALHPALSGSHLGYQLICMWQ